MYQKHLRRCCCDFRQIHDKGQKLKHDNIRVTFLLRTYMKIDPAIYLKKKKKAPKMARLFPTRGWLTKACAPFTFNRVLNFSHTIWLKLSEPSSLVCSLSIDRSTPKIVFVYA